MNNWNPEYISHTKNEDMLSIIFELQKYSYQLNVRKSKLEPIIVDSEGAALSLKSLRRNRVKSTLMGNSNKNIVIIKRTNIRMDQVLISESFKISVPINYQPIAVLHLNRSIGYFDICPYCPPPSDTSKYTEECGTTIYTPDLSNHIPGNTE